MYLPDGFSEFFLDGAREALLEGALDEALDKTGVVNNANSVVYSSLPNSTP